MAAGFIQVHLRSGLHIVAYFNEEDSGEVGVALDSIEEGGGGTFPCIPSGEQKVDRFVIPPGVVEWVEVSGLADDDDMEVSVDDSV